MGKNKRKKTTNTVGGRTASPAPKRSAAAKKPSCAHVAVNKKKLFIILGSSLALLAIVLATVFGVLHYIYNARFDFLSGDISKYIKLDREDYITEVEVSYPEPTERELENKILNILAENKDKTPLYNGQYVRTSLPIGNGWVVKAWYYGYTVGEGGEIVPLSGGSNYSHDIKNIKDIKIGEGGNVFEIDLIGKNMTEYSQFTSMSTGHVSAYDIISVDMTVLYPDGSFRLLEDELIDLTSPDLEKKWGEGFREAVVDLEIRALADGEESDIDLVAELDDGTVLYTDVQIKKALRPTVTYTEGRYENDEKITVEYTVDGENKKLSFVLNERTVNGLGGGTGELMRMLLGGGEVGVTHNLSYTEGGKVYANPKVTSVEKREDKPIVVEAYFPYDYKSQELRGKTVYFDVYITNAIVYNAPTLTDEFITDTLGISAEELSSYTGDTLTEKYRTKLKAELDAEYESLVFEEAKALVFANIAEKLEYDLNKLPLGEVKTATDESIAGFISYLELYAGEYETEAAAAIDYFGIKDGTKWREFVDVSVRESIIEKMTIYYIAREEGFLPDSDELAVLYEERVLELLERYLKTVHCTPEKYDTDEEYRAAVAKHREEMLLWYGEDSVMYELVQDIVIPKIVELSTVKRPS